MELKGVGKVTISTPELETSWSKVRGTATTCTIPTNISLDEVTPRTINKVSKMIGRESEIAYFHNSKQCILTIIYIISYDKF